MRPLMLILLLLVIRPAMGQSVLMDSVRNHLSGSFGNQGDEFFSDQVHGHVSKQLAFHSDDFNELVRNYLDVAARYHLIYGETTTAVVLMERLMDNFESQDAQDIFGKPDSRYFKTLQFLSDQYFTQREWEKALDTYVKRSEVYASDFQALSRIAQIHQRLGNIARAEEFYRKTVTSSFVEDSPSLHNLGFTQDLAVFLMQTERYEEADSIFKYVLNGKISLLGVDHPQVANVYNAMGLSALKQGRLQESENNHHKAYQIRVRLFDRDPVPVGYSLSNLGLVESQRNNIREADSLFSMALGVFETRLPVTHREYLNTYLSKTYLYRENERWEEALELLEDLLDKLVNNYRENYRIALGIRWEVMEVYRISGLDPIEFVEEQLTWANSEYPPGDRRIMEMKVQFANHLASMRRFEEALGIFDQIIPEVQETYGTGHIRFGELQTSIAYIHKEIGNKKESKKAFKKAISVYEDLGMEEKAVQLKTDMQGLK